MNTAAADLAALAQLADDGCPYDGRLFFHRRPAAARFWVHHLTGYVRLALRPGERAEITTGGPTDEGYHADATVYTHAGDGIECAYTAWGRDCDGRHEYRGDSFAPLGQLAAVDIHEVTGQEEARGIRTPEWEHGRRVRRDHAAEAAGY